MVKTVAGRALVMLSIAAFGSCGADGGNGPEPEVARTIPVTIGSHVVHAELATTLAERNQGLMGRTTLPDTAGMLFVFSGDMIRDFWMKDTPIDLAIAFLDSDKKILNIVEMTAQDLTIHRSTGAARYALEVRKRWFADRGIAPGATVAFTLPPGLTIDP